MANNPSAFPQTLTDNTGAYVGCEGMTLRDYFAAAAILMVHEAAKSQKQTLDVPETAAWCYRIADALLVERERR